MIRNASLKQLRTFAAAMRAASLSEAARTLNITAPAVTLQLQLLEQSAGMVLAERTPQGWRPTAAGQEVLQAADRIQAALNDCDRAIACMGDLSAGSVSVSVVSTAKYFAPRILAAFLKMHPRIELVLSVGNREETIQSLRSFKADIAVMGRPPSEFPLDKAVIGDHPHVLVAPPGHTLSSGASVKAKALAKEIFLLREQGSGTRILTDKFFNDNNISPRVMEIGSNETIKQAVMAGLGIALISAHTITAELQEGRIAVLKAEGTPITRQWFVVRVPERRLMPAAQQLWTFFPSEGRKLLSTLYFAV